MENKSIFAKNLQRYMDQNNVTRKDLCETLKLSYFTVTSWVNGTKYPRMDKVEMLANFFGIQKSDLIEDKSAEEKPVEDDGLTDEQRALIDFARSLSEEQALLALRVLKSIVESD